MIKTVTELFSQRNVELVSPISLSHCKILRPHKLRNCGFDEIGGLTAIMIAVPYFTRCGERNLSRYAVSRDYHLYFEELFGSILPILKSKFPQNRFAAFADNSPIDEREAAAAAGLGIIGDNMMLITEKYSSYVFLGEIITDFPIPDAAAHPVKHCEGCGACRRVCPKDKIGECLSSLSQKKGELSDREKNAVISYGSVWGCDICQEVCPHTIRAFASGTIYSPIEFFKNAQIPVLTEDLLDAMSDEEFSQRAYAWRGKNTVRRNLLLAKESPKIKS